MKRLLGDSELLELIVDGNEEAFTVLFERYCRQLYHVSFRYTASQEDAEDIVQEVFSKIWCYRTRLKPTLPFIPYIIKIAKNTIFNKSKRRLIEIAYLKYQANFRNKVNYSTEEKVFVREFEDLVKSEIKEMPIRRKKIFKLSRDKGLSNKEIATKLSISTSTVENQINKSLNTLREKLKNSSYI